MGTSPSGAEIVSALDGKDCIGKTHEIALALHAAMICKSACEIVGCKSWLVASLAVNDLRKRIAELDAVVVKEAKP